MKIKLENSRKIWKNSERGKFILQNIYMLRFFKIHTFFRRIFQSANIICWV